MRFFCDDHLRRLARWLRAAGYDVAWEPAIDDCRLIARCRAEKRTLLTLDRGLAERRAFEGILLPSHDPLEQLRFLVERLDLDPLAHAFSRCPLCNGELVDAPAGDVDVPERVRARCDRYWRCSGCGRTYWQGDHVDHMRERFRSVR